MALIPKQERENFVSILSSDATLRKVVPEGTEGSVVREYEDSKGVKGTKHELVFEEITGFIGEIKFVETDFGTLLQVTVDDEILSMSTASNFGEDFMKKLPNIDRTKAVSIKPFAFTPDGKDKDIKGLTIIQDEKKIDNFFYDKENKQTINGLPVPEGDTKKYKSDDWKIYFLQVRKFLIAYTTTHFLASTPVVAETLESVAEEIEQAF